jgi:hypothetical protein
MSGGAEVQPPPTQNERGCRWEINGERKNVLIDPTSLPAYEAVADHLTTK